MKSLRALLTLLLLAAAPAGAEVRWAVWPPTFYDTAEILLATDESGLLEVEVRGPGLDTVVGLERGRPVRVALPLEARLTGGGRAAGAAWRLAADGRFTALLQSPATEGLPDSTLWTSHDVVRLPSEVEMGTAYRALSLPAGDRCFGAFGGEPCADSWLAAVAVRDGTVLHLEREICGNLSGEVGPLAAGEAWVARCTAAGADVTGARLRSDAPFLLLSGSTAARAPESGGSWDTLLCAPPPEEAWGRLHHVVSFPRDPFFASEGDLLRVVGEPGTVIGVDDGVLPGDWPVPASGVLDLDGASWGGRPLRLASSEPVALAQVMKSRSHRGTGDPALAALPASDAGVRSATWPVPDGYDEGRHLGVVAPAGAEILLDGRPLRGGLELLPGSTHGYAIVELAVPARGNLEDHRLTSDRPFTAWVAGQGIFKSYAHALGWARPVRILRGAAPDALLIADPDPVSPWTDAGALEPGAPALLFYRVDGAPHLLVERAEGAVLRLRF